MLHWHYLGVFVYHAEAMWSTLFIHFWENYTGVRKWQALYPLMFEVSKLTKKPPRGFETSVRYLYHCLQWWHYCTQLSTYQFGWLSVFIVKCKGFDCGLWIWCFCYDFMVIHLFPTAREFWFWVDIMFLLWFHEWA